MRRVKNCKEDGIHLCVYMYDGILAILLLFIRKGFSLDIVFSNSDVTELEKNIGK